MPKPYPKEFRDDVVRVARNREPGRDARSRSRRTSGSSESCLHELAAQRRRRGRRSSPGTTAAESAELREAQQADPAARAGERGPAPGGGVSVAGEPAGKMMYPLVRELAADGIPVTVTCRVLKLARQPYYRWLAAPGHRRRAGRGATSRTRCSTPTATTRSSATGSWPTRPATPASRWRDRTAWRICSDNGWWSAFGKKQGAARASKAGPPVHDDLVQPGLHRRRAEPAVADRHHRAPDRRGQALPLRDQGRVLQPDRRLLDRLDRMKSRLAVAALEQRRRPPR